MSSRVIGTCDECGGNVVQSGVMLMIEPPVPAPPRCASCGCEPRPSEPMPMSKLPPITPDRIRKDAETLLCDIGGTAFAHRVAAYLLTLASQLRDDEAKEWGGSHSLPAERTRRAIESNFDKVNEDFGGGDQL